MMYSSRGISAVRAKAMSEQPPLVRQWVLLRTLCAHHYGASVKELAEELAVSEKTIRRDLGTFEQAGFPLEEAVEQFGRKRWRIDPAKSQPGLSFAFDEAVALYLARRLMEPLAGTPFWQAAQRAFKRIRASLGTQVPGYIETRPAMLTNVQVMLQSAVLDGLRWFKMTPDGSQGGQRLTCKKYPGERAPTRMAARIAPMVGEPPMPEFYAHSLEARPEADWEPMRQHEQKTTHVCRQFLRRRRMAHRTDLAVGFRVQILRCTCIDMCSSLR
jgi:hypothetical protein